MAFLCSFYEIHVKVFSNFETSAKLGFIVNILRINQVHHSLRTIETYSLKLPDGGTAQVTTVVGSTEKPSEPSHSSSS